MLKWFSCWWWEININWDKPFLQLLVTYLMEIYYCATHLIKLSFALAHFIYTANIHILLVKKVKYKEGRWFPKCTAPLLSESGVHVLNYATVLLLVLCCQIRITLIRNRYAVYSVSHVWALCDPMAHQVLLSMGFSREEYWPFPSPGDLPDSGMEPMSSALAGEFSTAEPPGKPKVYRLHV